METLLEWPYDLPEEDISVSIRWVDMLVTKTLRLAGNGRNKTKKGRKFKGIQVLQESYKYSIAIYQLVIKRLEKGKIFPDLQLL